MNPANVLFPVVTKKSEETTLYRHYDIDNNLLYVGISLSWNKRLTHCHSLPETNDTEIFQKYSEMAALFYDFKHCSQVYAETIVNELYLEQKSLKPVEWDVVDQLNSEETMLQRPRGLLTHNNQKKRPKWVVSNIRFKVAQDEHGVYNGK